jgi:hypothetical protein
MNRLIFTTVALLLSVNLFGQINIADSTVQVIGYWDKNEKQSYEISFEKYKLKEGDTTLRELVKYDVDITVIDSTSASYTVEWFYRNYRIETENLIAKKLISLSEDMKVIIKTDEMGAFLEVVNWREVWDHIKKSTKILKNELKDVPDMHKMVTQVESMYLTKAAIESVAIKDIHQFYTYHGAKYKLGEELSGQLQVQNNFGGNPFDADVSLRLDEINYEDDNSIIRMSQRVDPEQLTDATYEYLKKISSALGHEMPERIQFPPLINETWTASRIHGYTGWIIYSVETKEISTDNTIQLEERIIEII